mgnify:CR=1 FL=1
MRIAFLTPLWPPSMAQNGIATYVDVMTRALERNKLFRPVGGGLPGVELTAGLLGMGVSSFNDQIIQGLKLARSGSKS